MISTRTAALTTAALAGGLLGSAWAAKHLLPVRDDPTADSIALVSIFDGTSIRPTTKRFTGGTIHTVFGGTEVDLRRAELDPAGATLDVTTVLGGTEITVPDSWAVTVDASTMLAGVEVDVTGPEALDSDTPRLSIRARTVLAGLEVTSRPVLRSARAV